MIITLDALFAMKPYFLPNISIIAGVDGQLSMNTPLKKLKRSYKQGKMGKK